MQQMFSAESARRGRWSLPDLDPTNPTLTVVPWWTDRELRAGEVQPLPIVLGPLMGTKCFGFDQITWPHSVTVAACYYEYSVPVVVGKQQTLLARIDWMAGPM